MLLGFIGWVLFPDVASILLFKITEFTYTNAKSINKDVMRLIMIIRDFFLLSIPALFLFLKSLPTIVTKNRTSCDLNGVLFNPAKIPE